MSRKIETAECATLIGERHCPQTLVLKQFFAAHQVPFTYIEVTDANREEILRTYGIRYADLPVVICGDKVMVAPTAQDLAQQLGMALHPTRDEYDVIIVGAGPAGLAAGVYGGSEGLSTLILDKGAPGGQASTSTRIENYLGFPSGLSGAELTRRAVAQVKKFGVELLTPVEVVGFDREKSDSVYSALTLSTGHTVKARAIILATGVQYRTLKTQGAEKFQGNGVFYGASKTEAMQTTDEDVYIVGAANSAGQAAVNFAKYAKTVNIIALKTIEDGMSAYLVDQIRALPNIKVWEKSAIQEYIGDSRLKKVRIVTEKDEIGAGSTEVTVNTNYVFVFIGAEPHIDWVPSSIARDQHGFILTGYDNSKYQTSVRGIFAVGDIRTNSVRRVATAVGEGGAVVTEIHAYLASLERHL